MPEKVIGATFGEILAERAERFPTDTGFIYLTDGETAEEAIDYATLYARVAAIARQVQEVCGPEGRALLLFAPGLDYVAALLACFHAGVVAVSAAPPHPKRLHRTLPRLLSIAEDAEASCVLTEAAIEGAARPFLGGDQPLGRAEWLATDEIEPDPDAPGPSPDRGLAFLQYTSGSTADPRGVMLTHANLLNNCTSIANAFAIGGHEAEGCGFSWLPPYHDMGLIGGILLPLFAGGPSVLTSPLAVMKRPLRWLEGVSRYRATISGGPNFAYDLAVRRYREAPSEAPLDLSSWDVAFNGAEPIRAETLDAFVETFSPLGFRRRALLPCYGLAEATLMVTATAHEAEPTPFAASTPGLEQGEVRAPDAGEGVTLLVDCGLPAAGHAVVIVDEETGREAKPGQIGEIWVTGPSIAAGYWRRLEETAEVFTATLADGDGTEYLRTGDLGAALGERFYVVGRTKDLIIINGRNIHPHDIELAAEGAHPKLRPHSSSATADDANRLTLVLEVDPGEVDHAELAQLVRRTVAAELELQVGTVALCPPGAVPKTTSGKIQRLLCAHLLAEGEMEALHTWRRDGEG